MGTDAESVRKQGVFGKKGGRLSTVPARPSNRLQRNHPSTTRQTHQCNGAAPTPNHITIHGPSPIWFLGSRFATKMLYMYNVAAYRLSVHLRDLPSFGLRLLPPLGAPLAHVAHTRHDNIFVRFPSSLVTAFGLRRCQNPGCTKAGMENVQACPRG